MSWRREDTRGGRGNKGGRCSKRRQTIRQAVEDTGGGRQHKRRQRIQEAGDILLRQPPDCSYRAEPPGYWGKSIRLTDDHWVSDNFGEDEATWAYMSAIGIGNLHLGQPSVWWWGCYLTTTRSSCNPPFSSVRPAESAETWGQTHPCFVRVSPIHLQVAWCLDHRSANCLIGISF